MTRATAMLLVCLNVAWVQAGSADSAMDEFQIRWAMGATVGTGETAEFRTVENTVTMSEGDRFKIYLEALAKCHVYVVHVAPSGSVTSLYPGKMAPAIPVEAGGEILLPPADRWYTLDAETGRERIHLIASVTPQVELERALAAYDTSVAERRDEVAADVTKQLLRLRRSMGELTRSAEKPVSIAGAVRGQAEDGVASLLSSAEYISVLRQAPLCKVRGVYVKTLTIDHD